jgi:uncharacterized protein
MTSQQEEARNEKFGYVCRACSRCCAHKIIQVNPYEVARLARRTGQTIASFIATCTEEGGAYLKRTEEDVCIFLNEKGCSVHPDRPLVCRLYPLGRRVAPDGTEVWLKTVPHPQSEGEYTEKGTIADFIAAQGALPFMRAADEYAEWVRKADALIQKEIEDGEGEPIPNDLLDMDAAISTYCAQIGTGEPSNIEDRRKLHLEILYRQLDRFDGGDND